MLDALLNISTIGLLGDFNFSALLQQFVYNPKEPLMFSTGFFVWLFLAFIFIYALLYRHDRLRIVYVLAFSYYFYYKSSGMYLFLLALVSTTDFIIARFIGKTENKTHKKLLVTLSLLIDLGLLGYFKYTNFLGTILSDLNLISFHTMDIFLPVGISFFTFQTLSYTIDVYRGKLKPLDSLVDYAFYVSFFPQLVAGPIVRASDFIPQIHKPLHVSREMVGIGFWFIICGLFKKAIISDYISINFVDRIYDNPGLYSGIENLFGVYGYGLQVYCDFSGYSDMAIGIALLMGYHFNVNFNSPFKASSVSETWQRWHISLSSWMRDYVYISMGGNRKGRVRQYFNLFMTMFICGIWHGANWQCVMWGLVISVGLVVHKGWVDIRKAKGYRFTGKTAIAWHYTSIFLAFQYFMVAQIFFRAKDIGSAWVMTKQICTAFHPEIFVGMVTGYWKVFAIMALGFALHFAPDKWEQRLKRAFIKAPMAVYAIALLVLIFIVVQMRSTDIQPFIYFQF